MIEIEYQKKVVNGEKCMLITKVEVDESKIPERFANRGMGYPFFYFYDKCLTVVYLFDTDSIDRHFLQYDFKVGYTMGLGIFNDAVKKLQEAKDVLEKGMRDEENLKREWEDGKTYHIKIEED